MYAYLYVANLARIVCFRSKAFPAGNTRVLSGFRNALIYSCLCGVVRLSRLFRVAERALLTCGRGCLAVRYGLCHGAGRAFRECRKACSGFPNVLRRCSGVVFRCVRNVIMGGMERCPAVFRNLFHEKRLSKYFTSAQCINMRFRRLFAGDRSCVSGAEEE